MTTPGVEPVDTVVARDVFCLYPLPRGTVAALRGLTLRVARGERLVVHGPNGSGKTTLLRVLLGEQPVSAGSVVVDGIELAGAEPGGASVLRRDRIGFVDQHSSRVLRPELSVLDNVALQLRLGGRSRGQARGLATEALNRLGLAALGTRSPAGLSGGEAQRVAVAAAVAHHPALILADEPTGDLDTESADAVHDLLAAAADEDGATVVVVTHDRRAARIADRVVRIRDGRLSEQWAPAEPEAELLVVDDRGWLRLPEAVRRGAGHWGTVHLAHDGDDVRLSASPRGGSGESPAASPAEAEPLTLAGVAERGAPVLGLHDVRLRLGDRDVLTGLCVDVEPGQLVALSGRSGAGKSTALRVALGLVTPDSGSVTLAGTDVVGLGRDARARLRAQACAAALQGGALAEALDLEGNLAVARAARGGEPAAGDGSVVTALGLDPVRGRPARQLSGGERQRLALARCLVAERPLVVLDEPTSQQDEAHAELVASSLAQARDAGLAVLLATHDPVLLDVADQIITLG